MPLEITKLITYSMLLYNNFTYIGIQSDTTLIAFIGAVMLLFFLVGALFYQWRDRKRTEEEMVHLGSLH